MIRALIQEAEEVFVCSYHDSSVEGQQARFALAVVLTEMGFGPTRIGRLLDRNHSSVLHSLRRAVELRQSNRTYRAAEEAVRRRAEQLLDEMEHT